MIPVVVLKLETAKRDTTPVEGNHPMPAATPDFENIKMNMVDDVAVVEVLAREVRFPQQAPELSYELGLVIAQDWAKRTLIDLSRTKYFSSTGFAVLAGLVKKARELEHAVKFCGLTEELRVGADIIGLDKLAPIYGTEADALAAFAAGEGDAAPGFGDGT